MIFNPLDCAYSQAAFTRAAATPDPLIGEGTKVLTISNESFDKIYCRQPGYPLITVSKRNKEGLCTISYSMLYIFYFDASFTRYKIDWKVIFPFLERPISHVLLVE